MGFYVRKVQRPQPLCKTAGNANPSHWLSSATDGSIVTVLRQVVSHREMRQQRFKANITTTSVTIIRAKYPFAVNCIDPHTTPPPRLFNIQCSSPSHSCKTGRRRYLSIYYSLNQVTTSLCPLESDRTTSPVQPLAARWILPRITDSPQLGIHISNRCYHSCGNE